MTIETLAFGYGLIEGPRLDADGSLYFSDVTNGGVFRRSPNGSIDVVIPKRRGVGGIVVHADGGLVVSGRNVCHVKDGETRVVFAPDAPGLNDLMTDWLGRVYCGTIRSDPFGDGPRVAGECSRIELDGSITELYDDVSLTNGIGFSPDGAQMYHSDTGHHHVICHDVDGDGVTNRRALHESPTFFPDGLAVDSAGTVWVADYGNGCVRALSPDGEEVGRVDVPARAVTSLCFGGDDGRDLYITSADNTDDPGRSGSIFRTRVDVPGLTAPPARV